MTVSIEYFVEYANLSARTDEIYHYIDVEVSPEEYVRLAEQAKESGRVLSYYEGVDDIKARIEDIIKDYDRYYTTTGKLRIKPLKKPREIDNIGIHLTYPQYYAFTEMKDPEKYLSYPESEIKIFRRDGSSVNIRYSQGDVSLDDSKSHQCTTVSADEFISDLASLGYPCGRR